MFALANSRGGSCTLAPPFCPLLEILYEDNHLLALDKPAGLATMGAVADAPSLINQAKLYLKERYQKPGNVYLGVVSRLDAAVSGAVLFARTSKAAARLTEQFRSHSVEKTYWALVAGSINPPQGEWIDWVYKDDAQMRMMVASGPGGSAQEAVLRYRQLRPVGPHWLVEVELVTGRKHQIRLQLASRGRAILGDRKYGSAQPFPAGIGLHSRRLVFEHPTRHEPLELVAPLPRCWRRLGIDG
jgi:23S rRNA pseudouridine1911/1915/1917 synthase